MIELEDIHTNNFVMLSLDPFMHGVALRWQYDKWKELFVLIIGTGDAPVTLLRNENYNPPRKRLARLFNHLPM